MSEYCQYLLYWTLTLRQKIVFYRDIKRIDLECAILDWGGTRHREFRLALPLALDKGFVAYEVPMDTVQVGRDEIITAGAAYTQQCSRVHPREVQSFVRIRSL